MKKNLIVASLLIIAAFLLATTTEINIKYSGAYEHIAYVNEWTWVDVMNEVENSNVDFTAGDICGIDFGTKVVVIRQCPDGAYLAKILDTPQNAAGSLCPIGTLFKIGREHLTFDTN